MVYISLLMYDFQMKLNTSINMTQFPFALNEKIKKVHTMKNTSRKKLLTILATLIAALATTVALANFVKKRKSSVRRLF